MKKIVVLVGVLWLVGCKYSVNSQVENIQITVNQVKEHVEFLASDDLHGRNTGTEGIEKAAKYIENIFIKNNIKPYFQTYRDSFNAKDVVGYNILGYIEGNDRKLKHEFVVLGAHYDHIGTGKLVDGDSIANGANDNAAGTSAVIELAKYFASTKSNKRSILIALFSAEEMGLLGSNHLAKKLHGQNIDLYTMLNFEMIGVPFKDRNYVSFVTGYELSNMSDKINEYASSNFTGFSEVSKKYNLFRQSDNYAFYSEFKLPSQTISTCDLSNYDYYHHVDDEADKLDYEHMASFVNKVIPAIEAMCNTATKEIKMHE
ncbi:MAG: M20/M25/M40 family metallo-hydrolase [Flavobacteriales bacterium]|nr:M20/M25/M40 family metallo-hydrolase [Flavobacteriales bacterium]